MGQHCKERGRFLGVIDPAQTGRAPQFEKVAEAGSGGKGEQRGFLIGWGQNQKGAQDQGSEGERLVEGGPDEGQHEGVEAEEGEPVKDIGYW